MMQLENHFMDNTWTVMLFIFLVIWELVWKGIGLWKSARNNHKTFFIFCLITNTFGIVPIIYILMNKKQPKND